MANWLVSREKVKRAGGLSGSTLDSRLDRNIEGVSASIEKQLHRFLIPRTETRLFDWPPLQGRRYILQLNQWLISVTTLQTKAQDSSPTTISASDFFLAPANIGPPFTRIEIDLSSNASFESGDTPQRSISVLGSWGYDGATIAAGTVASGLSSDATVTAMVCSDATLIDVGDTPLIGSEQVFVTERSNAASGETITSGLSELQSEVTIPVDTGSTFNAGEIILIDSERMEIQDITSNNLTVVRAVDGSKLASHTSGTAVHVFRTLTIVRGNNGTTAAVHADATAITKYTAPFDIQDLAVGETLAQFHQESSGFARTVGAGEGAREFTGRDIAALRKSTLRQYQPMRQGTI